MKPITHLLLLPLLIHTCLAHPLFIGTSSDGIYLADFDEETGKLSQPALVAELNAPGFLAIHPEKPILYAAHRENTLSAFSISSDNSLTPLGEIPSGGKNPTHLSIDALGHTAAIANYGSGSITTIRLDAAGKPEKIVSSIQLEGSGPHPTRQNAPHSHGAYFDRENHFLFVPDLGIDKTLIYRFDPSTSVITEHSSISSSPGAGPRHMAFSPDEKHAYINNELDNTILAALFDSENGTLTPIATYPTLPADFEGESTTAEIEVHPSGSFVYVSNRGHDSITVYSRAPETGQLTLLQHAPCGVEIPRHFKISPSGKWLLCGGQKSNEISVMSLDPETGRLGAPLHSVKTPAPICLLFP